MAATVTVYDFLAENDSTSKWRGLLHPALRKIQKQVHPRLEIEDDAVSYLEELIYILLAQMCVAQPHSLTDVETYVQKNFATPIDTWALSEAQQIMERYAQKKKSVLMFPGEKIFEQLQKEVLKYKVELNVILYIMAILDYVSADILKLAGNFLKNTRKPAIYITSSDIRVSMSADPALQALFEPLQTGQNLVREITFTESEPSTERRSLSYDELLRELTDEEAQYIRQLNLILKVFREPFLKKPNLFPRVDVDRIFGNLPELYELSVQLLASLEECIEMAGEMEGEERCPQAGFVFEELAESEDFDAYSTYAENYMEAIMILEDMLTDADVIQYFKSLEPKLFKEAMQYILPKMLLEPIYHCFYYFEVMNALQRSSSSDEDQVALESALTCMLSLKVEMERQCARFLPKRKEDSGMFGRRPGYQVSLRKMARLQEKIEGWEGPDIFSSCTEFIMDGPLALVREGNKKKSDRHVFLLDGLAVCCKQKRGVGEYRYLKEKINMRRVKLINMGESDDQKFAFQLVVQDQPGFIFYTITKPEKNEWMAALTLLLTRSTFDRLLDAKLREEEATIPVLRPSPDHYRFAEEDSEENIMFDDKPEGRAHTSGPGPLIKAGTIYKLVERLTYHEYADPLFVRTFLMTYRSFCKPSALLDLLIERFHIPHPLDMEDMETRRDPLMMQALKKYKTVYVSPIQLRVLNVLRHWVEFHYYDFQRQPELLTKLKMFVNTVKSKNMQKWVASIHRALQKKLEEGQPSPSKPVFDKDPQPVEWHLTRNRDEYHILTLHPVEIARQLTLIQSEYFRAIHPSELVDASWMKDKEKEKASPNLLKLNRFETSVSNWLTLEIVFMENVEERVALVSRLVDIMVALRELNNFAGMFVVNAAFESASVYRLRHTFKELSTRRKQILDDMKLIASSDIGYKNYKEKLRSINPPCVPFLGMYLSWIVFIKDGNENKIRGKPDHFINFKKRRKIAAVLQEIQQYQNTPYCLSSEHSIQEYILLQDPIGGKTPNQWEECVFDQSRLIELKDQLPKRAPRRFKFDLKPPHDTASRSWGTIMLRRPKHAHPPIPHSLQDGQVEHDGSSGEPSPQPHASVSGGSSTGSAPSSPTNITSPATMENGFMSPDRRKIPLDRDRAFSLPAHIPPPLPPRLPPPRPPKHSTTMSELPPVPEPPETPPILPPRNLPTLTKGLGYKKPPPPPPPQDNDAPPLPPRDRMAMGPPLPPRVRERPPIPPPPVPPKGIPGR